MNNNNFNELISSNLDNNDNLSLGLNKSSELKINSIQKDEIKNADIEIYNNTINQINDFQNNEIKNENLEKLNNLNEEDKKNEELNNNEKIKINNKKEEEKNNNNEEKINEENKNNNPEELGNKINEENVNEDSKLNDVHFTEILKYGDKKIEIYHLIIANEDSEAGEIYNQYAYNFIENIYNLIAEPKQFDVFDQVKDNFISLSNTILNNNIEKASFSDNNKIVEEKKMKLDCNENLNLKKCYTDELKFSFFKTGNFEPKYNYFKPDEKTLEIRLEVPGNVKCDVNHKIVGDETIISIRGNKNKDRQPKEPNYNLFNIREFGEFEVNIPLKVEEFKISKTRPNEGYPKFVNGVCVIQYELAGKGEEGSAEIEGL